MPALSVVIPAYNVARFITAAVELALAQTMGDLEVIVVDDGSTDETATLVRCISDPRVVLVNKPNGGLSSARNAGIRVARGRYLGFLDGDDIWFPEKAEKQIAALEAEPGITMTYSHSGVPRRGRHADRRGPRVPRAPPLDRATRPAEPRREREHADRPHGGLHRGRALR